MKTARIVVLGVAVAAGGLAALLAGRSDPPPMAPQPVAQIETVEILVAKVDIGMGQVVSPNEMHWQVWPATAASPLFLRRSERPDAIQQLSGAIARNPLVAGEPVREGKLIKANGSGFMAAILPSGMRAISTEISPETSAGGFILPNDRVDVILSRRDRQDARAEVHVSEIILSNIRVLAIDQAVEEKNGQRVVIGKTATLELSPSQAKTLAVSRQRGTITLALRSIVDANAPNTPEKEEEPPRDEPRVDLVVQLGDKQEDFYRCTPKCNRMPVAAASVARPPP
jgi:pilus assembly protein CpaB